MNKFQNLFVNTFKLYKLMGYESISTTQIEDIFIVGYPKSGNTWMQHLMTGIMYELTMKTANNRLIRELLPDVHITQFYKRYQDKTCFKSHDLPKKQYQKVIYIVRDGRDAITSYYHMLNSQNRKTNWQELVIDGKNLYPSKWFEHVKAWLKNPYNAEILFIKYEDLHSAPLAELKKICKFVQIERSDDFLKTIIQYCSFGNMRKKESSKLWDKNTNWKKDKYFMRKGVVGDFVNEMPPNLLEHFNTEAQAELKHFNYL